MSLSLIINDLNKSQRKLVFSLVGRWLGYGDVHYLAESWKKLPSVEIFIRSVLAHFGRDDEGKKDYLKQRLIDHVNTRDKQIGKILMPFLEQGIGFLTSFRKRMCCITAAENNHLELFRALRSNLTPEDFGDALALSLSNGNGKILADLLFKSEKSPHVWSFVFAYLIFHYLTVSV
jgi:hypothetical protein